MNHQPGPAWGSPEHIAHRKAAADAKAAEEARAAELHERQAPMRARIAEEAGAAVLNFVAENLNAQREDRLSGAAAVREAGASLARMQRTLGITHPPAAAETPACTPVSESLARMQAATGLRRH